MECINSGFIRAKKRKIGGWIVDRISIDEYNSIDGGQDEALFDDFAKRAAL